MTQDHRPPSVSTPLAATSFPCDCWAGKPGIKHQVSSKGATEDILLVWKLCQNCSGPHWSLTADVLQPIGSWNDNISSNQEAGNDYPDPWGLESIIIVSFNMISSRIEYQERKQSTKTEWSWIYLFSALCKQRTIQKYLINMIEQVNTQT